MSVERLQVRAEWSSNAFRGREGERVRVHLACSCERGRDDSAPIGSDSSQRCARKHYPGECDGAAVVLQVKSDGSQIELCVDCAI